LSIENGIFLILSTYNPLTSLVGTRIYNGLASENDYENYIEYHLMNATSIHNMVVDSPIVRSNFQFSIYSKDIPEGAVGIQNIAKELRNALRRYRGTSAGVVIQDILLGVVADHMQNKETGLFHRSVDAEIIYEE